MRTQVIINILGIIDICTKVYWNPSSRTEWIGNCNGNCLILDSNTGLMDITIPKAINIAKKANCGC